jgi:Uma2 family endonuclease
MSTIAPTQRSTSPPPPPYRLSVDQYERLVEAVVLDDPRVELIDGYLVKKKWDAYAHGRIAVYWIINLVHRRVEVYTDPGPAGYELCQFFTTGQEVPVVIDGALAGRIAVAVILPSTT